MSTSALSAIQPVAHTDTHALVKTANGEFTAASVQASPTQGADLVKLKNGNYAPPIVAASDRYTAISTDLTTLKRGG